ncbi:carboxypeptidase-like regulatory domain-containing protein [Anaeromyxobacter oryzae]|uniref:PEGA domain-containing protein n=1 Tax=Anaeromyxobacter oryzae TaxID=2918170 RepID=A0ABM7WQA5_9BACT|nr:carboxypeptidase-like regulatory domain-containing protein [Anaeromyxobacter oryzae]BDG01648.1 hypothetical protein AMOR_06440 [Anaeromyxobacter oryzae]
MRSAVAVALVSLAACGGLETPDLRTGVVVGRISGAATGGYVYPLGRPELKVALAADGSFRIAAPAGTQSLVLYDGTFQRDPVTGALLSPGRAQQVEVEVEGADVRDVGDHPASGLPLAGSVLAGVRAESGARCKDPRFTVDGTDRDEVVTDGAPAAFLAPLPEGDYPLTVSMDGFRSRTATVRVVAGATTPYDTELLVDDGAEVKGCVATSGCDASELACHSDDGRCHYDGAPSATCGASCGIGGACGAGLACQGGVCTAPQGCEAYFAVAGSWCVADDACAGALVSGTCRTSDDHSAGICTAPCTSDAECAGFGAGASCSSNVCRPHM